jgi:uroporphyrinogen-III synthase
VLTVTPYRWVPPEADGPLARLIEATCAGQVDVLTFTSAPAAAAVLDAATALGRFDDLVAALRHGVMAAAVGPVTAAPLAEVGVEPVVPDRYRLLIRLVCDPLASDHVLRLRSNDQVLELRGRALTLGDQLVLLSPTALALFRRLGATDAATSKLELVACMPDGGDERALEVASAGCGGPRLAGPHHHSRQTWIPAERQSRVPG